MTTMYEERRPRLTFTVGAKIGSCFIVGEASCNEVAALFYASLVAHLKNSSHRFYHFIAFSVDEIEGTRV